MRMGMEVFIIFGCGLNCQTQSNHCNPLPAKDLQRWENRVGAVRFIPSEPESVKLACRLVLKGLHYFQTEFAEGVKVYRFE
jgi:hypothetical protein